MCLGHWLWIGVNIVTCQQTGLYCVEDLQHVLQSSNQEVWFSVIDWNVSTIIVLTIMLNFCPEKAIDYYMFNQWVKVTVAVRRFLINRTILLVVLYYTTYYLQIRPWIYCYPRILKICFNVVHQPCGRWYSFIIFVIIFIMLFLYSCKYYLMGDIISRF